MAIPTVDLSPFLSDGDDEGRKKVKEMIKDACSDYGFFQIINHGVPLHLITQSIELSTAFFALPDPEKLKFSPGSAAPLPAGYSKQKPQSPDKNEYVLMFHPQSGHNILPSNPPALGNVLEEMFEYFQKTGELIQGIVNDCMGLPSNFMKEYNDDRSSDIMVALSYYPATETEDNGLTEHGDPNCITLIIQDEVGGLQVKKDGVWIPVVPAQGTIVVNIGDVIQVLSNNKLKSAAHRVVRAKGRRRQSLAFFLNLEGEKWVEPLPQFTAEMGEAPRYRRFVYKEYQAMRVRNRTHPTFKPQDMIAMTPYAIPM